MLAADDKELNQYTEITVPVPWGHIAARWYGRRSQCPLIALHGWMDSCGSYARLAPLLAAQGHSLLCIDLPGHGWSSHLPVGMVYNTLDFVIALRCLQRAFKWQRLSLLGHSYGGSVAFHFAALYPQHVRLIIGLDIIRMKPFPAQLLPMVLNHIHEKAATETAAAAAAAVTEPPCYSFAECERLLYEASGHSVELPYCRHILERNVRRSAQYPEKFYFARDRRLKFLRDFSADEQLALGMAQRICQARIPYLVIVGGASTNENARSPDVWQFFSTQRETLFESHTVPEGTHHLHLNHPEPVANIIHTFLQRLRVEETARSSAEALGKL